MLYGYINCKTIILLELIFLCIFNILWIFILIIFIDDIRKKYSWSRFCEYFFSKIENLRCVNEKSR